MPWGFELPYKRNSNDVDSVMQELTSGLVASELRALRAEQDDPKFVGIDDAIDIKHKAGRRALIEHFLSEDERFTPPTGSVKKHVADKKAQRDARVAAEKEEIKTQHDDRLQRAMAWDAIEPQFEAVTDVPAFSTEIDEESLILASKQADEILKEFEDLGFKVA